MGAICSKSSHHTGGHTLVSQPPTSTNTSRPQQPLRQPQAPEARRSQTADAAERRLKAVSIHERPRGGWLRALKFRPIQASKRGVSAANPNSGQLAARLEASKSAPLAPEPRQEDALIVSSLLLILGCFFFFSSFSERRTLQWD